jgi:hypothetical protein
MGGGMGESKNVSEVSKELAQKAYEKSATKWANAYSAQPYDDKKHTKASNQMNTFSNYVRDKTKQEKTATGGIKEGRNGFQRMIVFNMYDKEGTYLGDLDPMNDEGYITTIDELVETPEFQKFSKEKNITREQIGRVRKEREYMMNGKYLEQRYYSPSQSEELFDPRTKTWYNLSGQQLRNPSEYDRGGEGYTPFGDEGDDY